MNDLDISILKYLIEQAEAGDNEAKILIYRITERARNIETEAVKYKMEWVED